MFCTGAVVTVKSCIGQSVSTNGQFFDKKAPLSSATHFKLSSN